MLNDERGAKKSSKPSGLINFWRFLPFFFAADFPSRLVDFYVKSSLLMDLLFMLLFPKET